MTPNQVTVDNAKLVFQTLYGYKSKREYLRKMVQPKLKPDVTVRKKYELKKLDRGYYPNWTDQIYKIYKSVPGDNKPYYFLKDEKGELINKRFYPNEIQKVKPNCLYRVEAVLNQKFIRGRKHFFVKWLNHPDTDNSWVPAESVTCIHG